MTRGLIIAAPRSGSGKTTVTMALVAALRRRGLAVRCAKSGPDYIDPAFHQAASGHDSINLDSWAMPGPLLDALVAGQAALADVLIIEASMGLFDGVGEAAMARGSAADLAARYGLPVLLVLDVSGQSQSAAAVARGFAQFDPAVRIAGVVLNRVGSARHRAGIVTAMERAGIEVLGSLPRDAAIALPERHLGLVQAGEQADLAAYIDRLADRAEHDGTIDAMLAAAAPMAPIPPAPHHALRPPGQRIALAQDAAFSFIYPHVIAGWRAAGATIVPFSPLADQPPPDGCDACWLPGGYPELHAAALAEARRFHAGLRAFAATRPVHGECGGFMVLGTVLEDAAGVSHVMTGLLDHATSFARRRLHLGYREATLCADGALGAAGARFRGHEFHYASVTTPGTDAPLATLRDALGTELAPAGAQRGRVSGSFFHLIAPLDRGLP
ncbi:cobyrinate a,c-diamide synthase [Acidiphilium sp.]|uniref:cobyrinate a,c-diamide synthase n=1 Tax=Acidiphilium sp. TaxID=527 RepID=UPI003D020AF0